jgi:homoserine trans-succinylase
LILHIFIGFFTISVNAKGGEMSTLNGIWLSINDYSRYKDVSISTIRRHIKNNILKHKEENGKYFIYVPSSEKVKLKEEEELLRVKLELELVRTQLRSLQEENNELRMLVNLYESQTQRGHVPPELPSTL